jgi:hypothetical protein
MGEFMLNPNRLASAAMLAGGLATLPFAARADNVVARWIQLGPGSSATALANGQYGDQPLSHTPTILARAIISGDACPALTVDGSLSITMTTRVVGTQLTSTPGTTSPSGATNNPANVGGTYPQYFVNPAAVSPANFPDGTAMTTTSWGECEAVVPAGHSTATIGSVSLKLPVANPQRILVIGDTGCRMATTAQQNCHSPSGFPFAALASYEALFNPDLIIHVGDYFYRDTNCVPTTTAAATNGGGAITAGVPFVPGCNVPTNAAYEPWGDTFDSWNADLFYPAQTLLAAAPWVMTRGNHESCGRGARGWFALVDPRPFNMAQVRCAFDAGLTAVTTGAVYTGDFTPGYVVPAGLVNLVVHDSSFANDSAVDANMAKNYDYDVTGVLNTLPTNSLNFFVTHKPVFGLASGAPTNSGDFTEQYAYTGAPSGVSSAFTGGIPAKVAMLLSGHIHQFEYVNFNDYTHYAPQLIVGVGGSNIDPTTNPNGFTPPSGGLTYAYQSQAFTVHDTATTGTTTSTVVHAAYSQAEFGFAVLDATSTGYIANVYNINSTKAGRCTITLSPRNIACWD